MKVKIKQLKAMLYKKPFYDKEYERALEEVFAADLEYLNTAINTINEQCGSVMNYLTNVLKVDVEKLRKYYLE